MDSQPFDPSCDPFLGFTSEIPIVPTQDSEPSFTRTRHQGPSRRVGVLLVATELVVVGLLAGFAAGYAFAHRVIVPVPLPRPSAWCPPILKPHATIVRWKRHAVRASSRLPCRPIRAPFPLSRLNQQ